MKPLYAAALLLIATPAIAAQPAFDCRYARQATEQLLCANERLAMLDQQNSVLFYAVRSQIPQGALRYFNEAARDWIAERNSCGWNVQCVEDAYTRHFRTLCSYAHVSDQGYSIPRCNEDGD